MKRIFIVLFALITCGITSFGQVTETEGNLKKVNTDTISGWKKGGILSLTFGQAAFSKYWAAGGSNSISINGVAGLFLNYKQGNWAWDNNLDLAYGLQRQGKGDDVSILKTDDKLDFSSKLGLKATEKLFYAALLNFKTQFSNGYNYPNDSVVISKFMAPGYLLGAIGIDYKPIESLSIFFAPATVKFTFVNDDDLADAEAFGVEKGKHMRTEFGGYLKTVYAKEVFKNVKLTTKLDLFSNYLKDPQNIDINWEVLLALKINKFLSANISTQLLYDHDVNFPIEDDNGNVTHEGPRIQFKEVLGIGFSLNF